MKRKFCPHPRHRVLVVDDDPEIRRVLSRLLAEDDVECLEAANGEAALRLAAEAAPCVALIDLQMPAMDGITLCRRLRSSPATAELPTALVSGSLTASTIDAALDAGASDVIRKPFDLEELRCRIQVLLRMRELALARQQSLEHLHVISQAAEDGILMMDGAGRISFWNAAAEKMFGYSSEEAIGRDLHLLLAPARFLPAHREGFQEFQRSGQGAAVGRVVELFALRKSGEEFPIELSLAATKSGGEWRAVGIVRDVSRRHALEAALRENEERLRLILDAMPVGVALVGQDRKIRWANLAVLRMAQCEGCLAEVSGLPCGSILCDSGDGPCPVLDKHQVMSGSERRMPRRDGSHLPVLKSVQEVEFAGERVLLEVFVDLTERKQLELELGHARKLEAVGSLAAGIAHEINTPIQFVGDSVSFLKEAFEAIWRLIPEYRQLLALRPERDDGEAVPVRVAQIEDEVDLPYLIENVPGALDRCDDGVQRVAKIVRAMKAFAHPDGAEKSPVNLNEAIESTLVIARNEYKYVADVVTELGELPLVPCFLGELNQTILNLLVNAAHSIQAAVGANGGRGVIEVRTRAEGDGVVIEISDTGTGIPEKIQERVFDPFFTTKPVGQGSGQGLAIARSVIVDKHRGTISFETTPGRGTTFRIRLPLDVAAALPVGGRS